METFRPAGLIPPLKRDRVRLTRFRRTRSQAGRGPVRIEAHGRVLRYGPSRIVGFRARQR